MPMPAAANYLKFTIEEFYRFIDEYEKHRMLFDFEHPLYTNYVERTGRFEAISRCLKIEGLTVERVRALIKVLHGNYTSRLEEFYKKQRTGEPFSAPHWWYKADKFLRSHIRILDPDIVGGNSSSNPKDLMDKPETIQYQAFSALQSISKNAAVTEAEVHFDSNMSVSSTVEVTEEQANDDEEQEISVKQMNVETEIVEDSRILENFIFLVPDDEELMAIKKEEMSIENVTARAEAASSQHHHQQQHQMSRKRASSRESVTIVRSKKSKIEDEFAAFGRCVALQLKTLPIDAALELESQIQRFITQKRMVLLRKNQLH